MKRYIHFSFVVILILWACTAQSQKRKNKQNKVEIKPKPEWVIAKPVSSQYYVGIGYSSTRLPNYQQVAKNNAFEDLLSEIKVNISSTSVLYQMDKKNSFREEYESVIKSTVRNEIEDFELVDVYENSQEAGYWVYYRLSKSKYAEQKRRKQQNALSIAIDFFQKAEESEKAGQTATAIDFYAKTILALKDYWGENLQADLQGKPVMLSNESYTRIQQILDNILLETASANIQLKKQTTQTPAISFKISYKKVPQRSMPVLAQYGKHKQSYNSTEKGEISVLLDKLEGLRNSFRLEVSLELAKIISGNNEDKFYKFLLESFRSPSQSVTIHLAKPTLFIRSEEKNLGNLQKNNLLANQLKNALTKRGYVFVNSAEKAEVILEIEADTRRGTESGGIYFAFLSINLKAIDNATKEEIYNHTLPEIKGGHTSFERAGIDAYQKASQNIESEVASKLAEIL
ncbi:MAG: LPP20 family lipoprotein [Raineya sp.]|nr:LPP20 family lipoprotein [Raineya sp.]MDW8296595.1 LPP20 family lipoprotein [Raineya sp.]